MMRAFLFAVSAALFTAACSQPPAAPADTEVADAGALLLNDVWGTPTPGGRDISAGYVEIVNGTDAEDRLIGASSPRAERMEIHEMIMDGDVMRMRAVEGGLAVAAGETVALAPGGAHLMFFGVTQPFAAGETIPVTLSFANAGDVQVALSVRVPTAASSEHSGH